MNCKPGDLAVIVRSLAGNEGRFVEVIDGNGAQLPGAWGMQEYGHLWRVRCLNGGIKSTWGPFKAGDEFAFPDAFLRPIRPGDITDSEVRDLYAPSDERMTATEVLAHQHKPAHAGYPS